MLTGEGPIVSFASLVQGDLFRLSGDDTVYIRASIRHIETKLKDPDKAYFAVDTSTGEIHKFDSDCNVEPVCATGLYVI